MKFPGPDWHKKTIFRKETLGRLLIALAIAAALLLNISRASQFGVFQRAPIWVLHAVPSALSSIFDKSVPKYTISKKIFDTYFPSPWQSHESRNEVNHAISQVASLDFSKTDSKYELLRAADDKGIVDFVEFGFRLFGPKIESVALFYYFLLALSTLIFFWRHARQPMALASVACILFSMYLFLPFVVLNPQLVSPLALRCMPLLSLIACFHCALYCWKPQKNAADLIAILLQAILIVFVLHIRSTAIWQIHLILLVTTIALVITWYRLWKDQKNVLSLKITLVLWPALICVAGVLALNLYRQSAFPEDYTKGDLTVTRPVWHNVYSGFALHPKFAQRESLRIDDISTIVAVGRHLKQEDNDALWKNIGGESPGFNGIKWAKYDLIVRDMVFSTCRTEPLLCAEAFLYYKPYYFLDTMMWFYGLRPTPIVLDAFVSTYFGDVAKQQIIVTSADLAKQGLTAAPWGLLPLVFSVIIVIGLVLTSEGIAWGVEIACMLAIFVLSIGPSIAGYPVPHGMIDSAVVITATIQIIFIAILALLIRRFVASARITSSI